MPSKEDPRVVVLTSEAPFQFYGRLVSVDERFVAIDCWLPRGIVRCHIPRSAVTEIEEVGLD